MYSRRTLVKGALATLAMPSLAQVLESNSWSQNNVAAPLRAIAAQHGRLFGSAAAQSYLANDPAYAQLFATQCGILVPEGELKWGTLRPTPTTFNFNLADWLLTFAKSHQMQMRGHTLVWHQSLPKWFSGYANPGNALQILQNHIDTVVGHYIGQLQSWDVVNEVLNPGDKIAGGWRDSPWYRMLGPGYVEMAFRRTYQVDPHTLLVWNENHIEDESYQHEQKRQIWLQQLRTFQAKGVPIGGIGIQSHLVGGPTVVGGPKFNQFLHQVSDMGLKILVTELDVQDNAFASDPRQRDQQVADLYSRYLNTVLQHKSAIAVLTWELMNKYSWLKPAFPRADGLDSRPLPFDSSMQPTAAYYAIRKAFQSN